MRRFALATLLAACASQTTPGAPAWRRVSTAGVTGRWGQTAQYDAARDEMLVFGGENDHGQLAELLVLHLDTEQWERTDASASVSPRTDLAGAIDTLNDRLVLIGGRQGLATSIDDIVALDLKTGTWQTLPKGPPARHDVAAASDGAHAWVFGGAGAFLQSLDDLWQLDFATDTWTQLPQAGAHPAARGSNAFVYRDNALYLVGGHDVSSVQRDVWRYDLMTLAWTRIPYASAPPAWAHFGWSADPGCSRVVLVGGDNLDNEDTSLATTLPFDTSRFTHLLTSNLPTPRDHASMIVDASRYRLVLFGGGTLGDGLGTLDDAWTLPLEPCP